MLNNVVFVGAGSKPARLFCLLEKQKTVDSVDDMDVKDKTMDKGGRGND